MKTLMIAALAVASGTVFAASSMPENKANRAVYDLTLTTKYLDRAKTNGVPFKATKFNAAKSKVVANSAVEAEDQVKELKDLVVPQGSYAVVTVAATSGERSDWNKKMTGKAIAVVANVDLEAEFENFKATFAPGSIDSVRKTTEQVTIYGYDEVAKKAVIVDYVPVVKQITYKVTDFHKPGKQVTKNLKGMVIRDMGKTTSYIWDDSIKDWVGPNPFAGSAADKNGLLKNVTIATASEKEGAYFRPQAGAVDTVAKTVDGGFLWERALGDGQSDTVGGWAIGTVKAANGGYVISSLSGNFAGSTVATDAVPANGVYGTWKAQYNDKATQILLCQSKDDCPTKLPARKYGSVDFNNNLVKIVDGQMIVTENSFTPETYEEILGTKKVEIVEKIGD